MATLVIKTNPSQGTDVLVPDVGIEIPASGGSVTLTEVDDLESAQGSLDLITLSTDDAFGVGSSTLILNDGSSDVAQSNVEPFLRTIIYDTSGAYSLPLRDGEGFESVKGIFIPVRNESGSNISSHKLINFVGYDVATERFLIDVADKDTSSANHSEGVTVEDINDTENGKVQVSGILENFDSSSFSLGDELVLGNNGNFSLGPPQEDPFTGVIQPVGNIVRVDATDGQILLNLLPGKIFITPDEIFAFSKVLSRGHISGGLLTRGGGLDLDVSSGEGFVFDSGTETYIRVLWSSTTLTLPSMSGILFVYVDQTGTILTSSSEPDLDENIVLGNVRTGSTNVELISKHIVEAGGINSRNYEYSLDVLGPLTVSGGISTINGSNSLSIDVDAATFYVANNKQSTLATAPITFTYWYRDGSGDWTLVPSSTEIDPNNYDDGSGTLASMPANSWKKDLLFIVCNNDGSGEEYHVVYAQETFSSKTDAVNNGLPVVSQDLSDFALRSGAILVEEGATSIEDILDVRPFLGQLAPRNTSVTDHGNLSGLGDDDHPQYLLADGSRTLTGSLDLGSNSIVNVSNVDGRDVSVDGSNLDSHIADLNNPHSTSIDNIVAGTLAQLNANITDATLDDSGDSRTPSGAAGGQLGSTYPNPDVRGIRETGGPTLLDIGSISDGQFLARNGTDVVGIDLVETLFDAVVDPSGDADFTLPSAAFLSGAKSVFVRTGTYVETADVVVPDGGLLIGEEPSVTIDLSGGYSVTVDGNGGTVETAGTISFSNGSTTITGSGTTFTNLSPGDVILLGFAFYEISSVTNNTSLELVYPFRGVGDSGIDLFATSVFEGVKIQNLRLVDSTGTGLLIRGCKSSYFSDLHVINCLDNILVSDSQSVFFTGITSNNATSGDGLDVTTSKLVQVSNSNFSNNSSHGVQIGTGTSSVKITNSAGVSNILRGIQVSDDATDVLISSCVMSYNNDEGFDSSSTTSRVTLSGCIIFNNGDDGLDFDSSNSTIDGCLIGFNAGEGIQGGAGGVLTGNHVFNNGGSGMQITGGDDNNIISSNRIYNNTGDGIQLANSTNVLVIGNHVTNNNGVGIEIAPTSTGVNLALNRSFGNSGAQYSITETSVRFAIQSPGNASQGEILYNDGGGPETGWARLSPGTTGEFLQTNGVGSNPSWSAVNLSSLGTGTLAELNSAVTDATLDDSGDSRPPTGPASGQLGGAYPSPDVRGIRETGGPTLLDIGDIADGDILVRSGTDVVGAADSAIGFSAYDGTGGTGTSGGWTDIPLTAQNVTTAGVFSHTPPSAEVTVNEDGLYLVIGRVTAENDTSNSRTASASRIMLDTGSGFAEVDGSRARLYHRNASEGGNTGVSSVVLDLTAGDVLKVQTQRISGGGNTVLVADGSGLAITAFRGLRGEKGDTGAGSNVTVADEGSSLGNFDTLNFTGVPVTATDAGGGQVDIEIDSKPFADEISASGTVSTTSTTFVVVSGMTTTPAAGTYRVSFSGSLDVDDGEEARVEIAVAGTSVTDSERVATIAGAFFGSADAVFPVATEAVVTVNGAQSIAVRWRSTTGASISFVLGRTLTIIEVAP